jgi:hypothetical protein
LAAVIANSSAFVQRMRFIQTAQNRMGDIGTKMWRRTITPPRQPRAVCAPQPWHLRSASLSRWVF